MTTTTRHDGLTLAVTEIRRGEGPIEKVPYTYGAGHQYRVPIVWLLEDGTTEESSDRFRLLRDAKAFEATLPTAPAGSLKLEWKLLHERDGGDGQELTIITRHSFYIGPR